MNFDFSDDQKELKAQARKFLADKSSVKAVRAVLDKADVAYDAALWKGVAELGWLGVAISEEHGGLGLGRLELCVLAEEMGRACAPIPFSSTLYFFAEAVLAAGSDAQKKALLPKVADGSLIGCFAMAEGAGAPTAATIACAFDGGTLTGAKIPVADGDIATHAVVLAKEGAGTSLVLVDLNQAGVTRETLKTLDPTRSHAKLTFAKAKAERLGAAGQGWTIAEQVLDRAAVLLAFEQIGGSQACLDMAVDYAKNRFAFSRQIGSYQGIKHKLADVYVALEVARSNAFYGAWALSTDAADLPIAAAAARVAGIEAYHLASKENIQTHGGMGFTWEVDCHLFYRRAKLLAVQAGALPVWKEKLVSRLEREERRVIWLHALAVVHALSLMIGEAYRSWGVQRPVAFWMDDMLAGALLIAGAVAVGRPTPARRALFTGGWGVCAGMLYSSFFGKVFEPASANAGNFDLGLLTALIGLAFATAVVGFVWSVMVKPPGGPA